MKLGVVSLWEEVERVFEGRHSTGSDEVRQELECSKILLQLQNRNLE